MESKKKAVAESVARNEVERWLDHKRVNEKHRNANSESIENMVDAFAEGTLILDDDHNIIMNLTWPVGEGENIKQLKFKPRLRVGEIQDALKGLKAGDVDARILSYIATLTDQPRGIVRHLDTEDYRAASAITVFFF